MMMDGILRQSLAKGLFFLKMDRCSGLFI